MRKKKKDEKPYRVLRQQPPKGNPQLVGYARVSTREQSLDSQVIQLRHAGCGVIYSEKCASFGIRPGWAAMLEQLRPGDVLVVSRVDRMGRQLSELVRALDHIRDVGAHVLSLQESIDTRQKGGRFALQLVGTLAEKVRDDIRERTREGLAALKAKGQSLGRPSVLEPAKVSQIDHLRAQGYSLREIARACHVGKTTVAKALEIAAAKRGDARQLTITEAAS